MALLPSPTISRRLAACAFTILSWVTSHASAQVLSYNFADPAGTVAVNRGTGGAAYNLTMYDATGALADLHSGNVKRPGGVAFLDGGASLNLTAATGMGSTGVGPYAASNTAGAAFYDAKSFTITGWYNTSSSGDYSGARLMQMGGTIFFINTADILILQVGDKEDERITFTSRDERGSGGAFYNSHSAQVVGKWVFFAVTYDALAQKVAFYQGAGGVNPLTVFTIPFHNPPPFSATALTLGGSGASGKNVRPFQGSFAHINAYVSTHDSTGALSEAQVAAVYRSKK